MANEGEKFRYSRVAAVGPRFGLCAYALRGLLLTLKPCRDPSYISREFRYFSLSRCLVFRAEARGEGSTILYTIIEIFSLFHTLCLRISHITVRMDVTTNPRNRVDGNAITTRGPRPERRGARERAPPRAASPQRPHGAARDTAAAGVRPPCIPTHAATRHTCTQSLARARARHVASPRVRVVRTRVHTHAAASSSPIET